MDDVKLHARSDDDLMNLLEKSKQLLSHIGLEINPTKSASNVVQAKSIVSFLDDDHNYKYLGLEESKQVRSLTLI